MSMFRVTLSDGFVPFVEPKRLFELPDGIFSNEVILLALANGGIGNLTIDDLPGIFPDNLVDLTRPGNFVASFIFKNTDYTEMEWSRNPMPAIERVIRSESMNGIEAIMLMSNTTFVWARTADQVESFMSSLEVPNKGDYNEVTMSGSRETQLEAPCDGEIPGKKDHINPSHYKSMFVITNTDGTLIDEIQWIEQLQFKKPWRDNMKMFCSAVIDLCSEKYLARLGMKDDERQEMEKSLWYHKFATAIAINGYKAVRIKDIDAILAGHVAK